MRKSRLFVFRTLFTLTSASLLFTGCSSSRQMAVPQPTPQPAPQPILVPQLAIIANRDDNTVSTYSINASTGELRSSGSIASGGNAPIALAVDPTGHFAYVANLIALGGVGDSNGDIGGGGISAFSINTDTGAFTPAGSPVAAGQGPRTVIVHPSGKFLYGTSLLSDNIFAYTINPNTGALTPIGSPVPTGT